MNEQLELPFLTPQRAATIHAAAQAVERSVGAAIAARRYHEAEEYARIGSELLAMLDDNAAAVRADHPARHPGPDRSHRGGRSGALGSSPSAREPTP